MTTIDHAAEARKLVADYCEIGEQSKKAGLALSLEAIVTLTLSEAQVHASLALVEQHRIANLIALHRHEVEYDIGGDRSYLFEPGTEEVLDDIKKGLGL